MYENFEDMIFSIRYGSATCTGIGINLVLRNKTKKQTGAK